MKKTSQKSSEGDNEGGLPGEGVFQYPVHDEFDSAALFRCYSMENPYYVCPMVDGATPCALSSHSHLVERNGPSRYQFTRQVWELQQQFERKNFITNSQS